MPKLDDMLDDVLLESVEVSVVECELVSSICNSYEELADSSDPRNVRLPSVRDFSGIDSDRADSVGEVAVGGVLWKKQLEGSLGDSFLESAEGPVGHAATKTNSS
jgi:hypothetical protein